MLTEKEIQHIADLARIKLGEKEKKGLQKDLSSILDYAAILDKAAVGDIKPIFEMTGAVNTYRDDENKKKFPMNDDLNEKLIGQAPHKEKRFVKVKSVFERK